MRSKEDPECRVQVPCTDDRSLAARLQRKIEQYQERGRDREGAQVKEREREGERERTVWGESKATDRSPHDLPFAPMPGLVLGRQGLSCDIPPNPAWDPYQRGSLCSGWFLKGCHNPGLWRFGSDYDIGPFLKGRL